MHVVQHGSVFPASPSLANPYTFQLFNVLPIYSHMGLRMWKYPPHPSPNKERFFIPGFKSTGLSNPMFCKLHPPPGYLLLGWEDA